MDKRKQIIVNPKVQLTLIALVVGVAVLPIIGMFVGIYFYIAHLMKSISPDNVQLLRILESMQTLNMYTSFGFIVILSVLAFVETVFLHRVIGPIYRIESDLEQILGNSNYSKRITIRKNDYLHEFVEILNSLLGRLESLKR